MKQAQEIETHLLWVRQHPGATWHVREIWDAANGWRLEWEVEGARLQLLPVTARQLVRVRLKELTTPLCNVLTDVQKADVARWFKDMDRLAKNCLRYNRIKAVPAGSIA